MENICYIFTATLGLSIPLLFRGTVAILKGASDAVYKYTTNADSWVYNLFAFVVGEVTPLAFQLFSLVFGYIRR